MRYPSASGNLVESSAVCFNFQSWFSLVLTTGPAPVRLTIALVFLYQSVHFTCLWLTLFINRIPRSVLGWSSLAGVLVVMVAWILNWPLARWNIWVIHFMPSIVIMPQPFLYFRSPDPHGKQKINVWAV